MGQGSSNDFRLSDPDGAVRKGSTCSFLRWIAPLVLLGLAVGAGAAQAKDLDLGDLDYDIFGHVNSYVVRQWVSGTDLVPAPNTSDYPKWKAGLEPVVNARLGLGPVTARLRTRARLESGDRPEIFLDEAFAEYAATEQTFLFAGRRIWSDGRSYGLNPADLFRDPREENVVFPSEFARADTKGDDMIGSDFLFNSGGSLTVLVAPWFDRRDNGDEEVFPLLRYRDRGFEEELDYSISLMGGDRPGLGLSGVYGIGESSLLYVDSTLRQGREKQAVDGVEATGALRLARRDESGFRPYVTLGFEHTFTNGLTLNTEYTHDAGGYSSTEWERITNALETLSAPTSSVQGKALGQLNGVLDHYTLRRNYGFIRLAYPDLFSSPLSTEVNILHGFDDMSGSVSLRFLYPIHDQVTIGLRGSHKYGGPNDEFTLRPGQNSLSIFARFTF